jgi:hypothetical protein
MTKTFNRTSGNRNFLNETMVTVSDVETSYPNIIFQKRTKQDKINKALLDDIQKAAAENNQKVTVDFAKSGHGQFSKSGKESRHWKGSAVDIDFVYEDGKKYAVSPQHREIVEKFTNTLKRMGYNKNAEGKPNPKAFLTFGFEGHSDHVHVSNLSDQSSEIKEPSEPKTDDSDTSKQDDSDTSKSDDKGLLAKMSPEERKKFNLDLLSLLGMSESKNKEDILTEATRIKELMK